MHTQDLVLGMAKIQDSSLFALFTVHWFCEIESSVCVYNSFLRPFVVLPPTLILFDESIRFLSHSINNLRNQLCEEMKQMHTAALLFK